MRMPRRRGKPMVRRYCVALWGSAWVQVRVQVPKRVGRGHRRRASGPLASIAQTYRGSTLATSTCTMWWQVARTKTAVPKPRRYSCNSKRGQQSLLKPCVALWGSGWVQVWVQVCLVTFSLGSGLGSGLPCGVQVGFRFGFRFALWGPGLGSGLRLPCGVQVWVQVCRCNS